MIYVRRVVGDSMLPTIKAGRVVVAFNAKSYKNSEIVIATQNSREVIKRIVDIEKDNYYLCGDNLAKSTDSRKYGWVSIKGIKGRVFWII